MGLEKVINDIMDTAHTEVSRINTEADVEESQILDEAKENAKQIRGNRLVEANLDIERMRRQEISSAKLEVKRAILNARKEALEKVYNNTVDLIATLPDPKQEELLKAIIETNQSSGARIYSNEKSEDIVKKLSSLEYAGNIDCIGGVVIENEDGTIRLDYRYDVILKNVYEHSLKNTSEILFG